MFNFLSEIAKDQPDKIKTLCFLITMEVLHYKFIYVAICLNYFNTDNT